MKARVPHKFIILLSQYDVSNVLVYISKYSAKIFRESSEEINAVRREMLHIGSSYREILVSGWHLVDLAYLAIKNCNGNKSIQNDNEFFQLFNLFNGYFQEAEKDLPLFRSKDRINDTMLYLYSFFGEQCMFQDSTTTAVILDNYCRNRYLLDSVSKKFNTIDIDSVVADETGLNSCELSAALWCIFPVALRTPFILNVEGYYNRGIIDKNKVKQTVEYFASEITTIKNSKLERQQLYATPFIKLPGGQYILNNVYLLLFLFENAPYWVVRNHYLKKNSQDFVNAFGDYFEAYFEEILNKYLDKKAFYKIPEGTQNRADWFLKIGEYAFIIEQKSALVGLNAKQQLSDIEKTKIYITRNWLKALKQLEATEKLYKKEYDHIIKIVLVYEDYFKDEILENAFKLKGNNVIDDGYYWLASIADIEMLLYTYKTNPDLFYKIIEEKVKAETTKSTEGRELARIMNNNNVDTNEHIHSTPYNLYKLSLLKNSIENETPHI